METSGDQSLSLYPGLIIILLMLFFYSVPSALIANFLAKEKGRKVVKWTALGAIPVVGFFMVFAFVGAAHLRLEQKIDELLARGRMGRD